MKKLYLPFILSIVIVSCTTPNATVDKPAPVKSNEPKSTPTPVPQNSLVPSPSPTPSTSGASPEPTVSPIPENKITLFQEGHEKSFTKLPPIKDNNNEYHLYIAFNGKARVVAQIDYSGGHSVINNELINWSSEKPEAVSVTDDGEITAHKKEEVYIKGIMKSDEAVQFKILVKPYYPLDNGYPSRATFNGKVFDIEGKPLEDATVTAYSIDPNVIWSGEEQKTIGGNYVFRNVPVGARLAITATKPGYTTRTRTEVLKSNLSGDPEANRIDFGGSSTYQLYAIQDEPQVISVRVNGTLMERGGEAGFQASFGLSGARLADADNLLVPARPEEAGDSNANWEYSGVAPNIAIYNYLFPFTKVNPGATSINRDKLETELTFSEPAIRSSVENNFRIYSETINEQTAKRVPNQFIIDRSTSDVNFVWSDDDTKVTITADKPLYTVNEGDESRYTLTFASPFKDKAGTDAEELRIAPTNTAIMAWGYFRFSTTQSSDYVTFSVQRDTVSPALVSVSALDNRGNDDIVIFNFSEPLDIINVKSVGVDLMGPATATANKQLFTPNNLLTQLGYVDGGNRAVYSLTRVNNNGENPTALFAGKVGSGGAVNLPVNALKSSDLSNDGRTLTLTFANTAFDRNDRIIVSIGNSIIGEEFTGLSANTDANLTDPAGNPFSDANSTTSSGVHVDDSQKVVTAAS